MTVEQLIDLLLTHPLEYTVKIGETREAYPLRVTKSHMRERCVYIGENREPTEGG